MLNDVAIRASTREDTNGFHAALDSVARERRFIALLEAPKREDIESFANAPNVVRLVAIWRDSVVGWADVQRMERLGYAHRGVLGMGVVAGHRRRGIGRALLDAVLDRSRALGVSRLELEVFRSNVGAIALYRQAGFQLEGERVRGRILDGVVDDILLMCRWDESTG